MSDDAPAPLSTPRLDAIRAPLSGDSPAGLNVAYEDDFQTLKTEVDALGAAKGGVDFDAIVDLATRILSEQSKDITVASYLMLGLTRTEGFQGIAEGLAAVRAVTEGFWEDAFPPLRRMRGRQAALQLVAERTSAWIQGEKATPGDREALEHAQAEAESLQAFVMEAMGEDAPAFSGLLREIREALRRLPKPKAPEPEAPPAAEAPSETEAVPAAPAAAPAAPPVASGQSATFTTASEAVSVVMKVASFFQEQTPHGPMAFLLRRSALWGEVVQPPAPGLIPAPQKVRRDGLATMLAAGNHAVLVGEAESTFTQEPFWLDLQRMIATALQALGPPAAAAHAAVTDMTAAFVRRFPALPTLTFQDGTPFADPMTATWLTDLTASPDVEGATGSVSDAAVREAQAQAAGGDVPGAIASLMAGAGAPRDRFERTVAAAEMCLGAGRPDVALGLLDDAEAAIESYRLDVWDPATAATALRLIHSCCSQLRALPASPQRSAALHERADQAFDRLARLDPAHALRSTPPPKA